jgi:hypothetical protein
MYVKLMLKFEELVEPFTISVVEQIFLVTLRRYKDEDRSSAEVGTYCREWYMDRGMEHPLNFQLPETNWPPGSNTPYYEKPFLH